MPENQQNEKELSDYKKRQKQIDELTADKVELTAKVQELWEKAAELDSQVLGKQRENEALKAKLEALNQTSRNELAKKNAEIDLMQKTQPENAKLLKENGALSAEIETVKYDLLCSEQKYDALKSIEIELNARISAFKKSVSDLNAVILSNENELKELNLQKGALNLQVENLKKQNDTLKKDLDILSIAKLNLKTDNENLKASAADLKSQIDNLNLENAAFKKQIGAKNSKMNTFKTVVIFLAVLANFLLLGKKFMGLTGETDWQTYFISYGSVLIFDLTVIFLTMVNRSKEALYFGIGVFILTFFQIGKPFLGLGLKVAFFGFDLPYFERIISGCIYSFFFAFLSYFLSKIKTD